MTFATDQLNHGYVTMIEIYSKLIVAKRFIRALKNISKYMTAMSKNVHINKLDDIVDKNNNTYHRPIKMKPIFIKTSTYVNFDFKNNDKKLQMNGPSAI